MNKIRELDPVLLVIDCQKGFLDVNYWGGNRNNKNAEHVCSILIKKWRELKLKIIHIRHSDLDPNSPLYKSKTGFEFNNQTIPINNEMIITKNVNSAFIGTNLKETLDNEQCKTLVIIGLTTDHCVSTTIRMASNYGYNTYLISDATATFDKVGINGEKYDAEQIHQISLASLKDEFSTILTSDEILKLL
jgi:nicotinamidase-related amidase